MNLGAVVGPSFAIGIVAFTLVANASQPSAATVVAVASTQSAPDPATEQAILLESAGRGEEAAKVLSELRPDSGQASRAIVALVEPLPDIDFNIRAGNTLVGYATYADVKKALTSKLDLDNSLEAITKSAADLQQTFKAWRDAGRCVISGFHSPLEQQCLEILLRGKQPIVMALARGLGAVRLPAAQRKALDEGRLMIISPFPVTEKRVSADLARQRNRFAAALVGEVVFGFVAPGGSLALLRDEIRCWDIRTRELHAEG